MFTISLHSSSGYMHRYSSVHHLGCLYNGNRRRVPYILSLCFRRYWWHMPNSDYRQVSIVLVCPIASPLCPSYSSYGASLQSISFSICVIHNQLSSSSLCISIIIIIIILECKYMYHDRDNSSSCQWQMILQVASIISVKGSNLILKTWGCYGVQFHALRDYGFQFAIYVNGVYNR